MVNDDIDSEKIYLVKVLSARWIPIINATGPFLTPIKMFGRDLIIWRAHNIIFNIIEEVTNSIYSKNYKSPTSPSPKDSVDETKPFVKNTISAAEKLVKEIESKKVTTPVQQPTPVVKTEPPQTNIVNEDVGTKELSPDEKKIIFDNMNGLKRKLVIATTVGQINAIANVIKPDIEYSEGIDIQVAKKELYDEILRILKNLE